MLFEGYLLSRSPFYILLNLPNQPAGISLNGIPMSFVNSGAGGNRIAGRRTTVHPMPTRQKTTARAAPTRFHLSSRSNVIMDIAKKVPSFYSGFAKHQLLTVCKFPDPVMNNGDRRRLPLINLLHDREQPAVCTHIKILVCRINRLHLPGGKQRPGDAGTEHAAASASRLNRRKRS